MPIYTDNPYDDGAVPSGLPLVSSLGVNPKITKTIDTATKDWLDKHPEATTSVQDGSITKDKLSPSIIMVAISNDDIDLITTL